MNWLVDSIRIPDPHPLHCPLPRLTSDLALTESSPPRVERGTLALGKLRSIQLSYEDRCNGCANRSEKPTSEAFIARTVARSMPLVDITC